MLISGTSRVNSLTIGPFSTTKWDEPRSVLGLIWVKQCHEPARTGNGQHTPHKNGDLGDDYGSFAHILPIKTIHNRLFIHFITQPSLIILLSQSNS